MKTGKIISLWEIIAALIVLIVFLGVLAPSRMGEGEEYPGYGVSLLRTKGEDLQGFLEEFVFVPGSAVLVEDQFILAMFQNPEKELYALAMFDANCDSLGCLPGDLVAYSIVDAQGEEIRQAGSLQINGQQRAQGYI